MKSFLLLSTALLFYGVSFSQTSKPGVSKQDTTKPVQVVEAACGQCKFGLTGNGCDLAVRIKDTAYFVEGTTIDEHGDAHAENGFCNAIRKATVQGDVINGRFKVRYFKLVKEKTSQ